VTVNDLVNAQQFGNNTKPNSDGVVYWTSTNPLPGGTVAVNGLLAVTRATNVINVATGIGMVQGWNFVNDAVVSFDFAADPGNASATDLIVLERGDPAVNLTVRLARVKGAASTLATVTQSEALWQVAIAQVPLSAGGLPTSVVDVRRFVGQVMSWRQGGSATDWSVAGTTNHIVGNVSIQAGAIQDTIENGSALEIMPLITFPVAFSYPPIVTALVDSEFTGTSIVVNQINTITSSQVQFIVKTSDDIAVTGDTDFVLNWIAIGLRA
jgi:hypothetical protein